jgi:phosphoribosyl-ATP pyrophosphohydrolase
MKEKTVDQIKLTPIEEFYTQQIIKPQDVITYNKVEEETLETTVKKGYNNREVQAINKRYKL